MDKHIELSYCDFESFKVLAKLYLLIDEEPKFDVIKDLLEVSNMTPADVSENFLPKCPDDDAGVCLDNLICALEKAKEEQDVNRKAMEEAQKVVDEDGDDCADNCEQS
ncbi:AAA-ATPase At3g28540-like [Amaranthus tricolor]|uniref:AAA-ATPase At3g28540-like n=1 Tax=Amaranthus tricolor TaxID=29722 RepID=UPI002583EA06|nr:AAA-ATPase At3g28540-like [Amaranthus tricolor]